MNEAAGQIVMTADMHMGAVAIADERLLDHDDSYPR